jgi:hypothetical protein
MIARAAIVLAMVIAAGARASAQGRTDVVMLANGDRITGEIVELARGRLEFKTDDAGTIYFEWDNIARVESTRQFDVSTSDGRRFLGSLGRSSDRSILVEEASGAVTLPMPEVTEIGAIGTSFWKQLDGSVDAGFNYTRSSGIAQTALNSNTVYRRPAFLAQLTTSATLTQGSDEDEGDDRAAAELSYVRYTGRRWFIGGAGRLETNESLGLALRSQAGGWTGVRPVNTNRAQLEFGGGLVVNNEDGVDTPSTQNVEGLVVLRTSYYSYDRPKTNVDASTQYYPSLSQWGRQRLQADGAVNRELVKDFIVGLHVFDTFDSAPPDPEAARNDVGVVLSIGWSY